MEKKSVVTETKSPKKRGNPATLAPPWKPGQSGNPSGRPKTSIITSRLEKFAETTCPPEFLKVLKLKRGATWADAWILMMNRQALGGEKHGVVQAFREIVDRLEGKAIARMEMTGAEGGPIEVEEIRGRLIEKLLR